MSTLTTLTIHSSQVGTHCRVYEVLHHTLEHSRHVNPAIPIVFHPGLLQITLVLTHESVVWQLRDKNG